MSDTDTVDTLKKLARVGLQNQKYGEVVELLGPAMVEDDRDAEMWTLRGSALHSLGRFFEAWIAHDIAVGLEPRSDEAWIARGDLMNDILLLEEALRSYDQSVEISAGGATALERRGCALQNLGSITEALESYDRAIAADPAAEALQILRADCLMAGQRFEEAENAYESLASTSSNPDVVGLMRHRIGASRAYQGKGLRGKLGRLFGVEMPRQWRTHSVDVYADSRVEASLRAGNSLFATMAHELWEAAKAIDPSGPLHHDNPHWPAIIERLADEFIIPLMRKAREGKELTPAEQRIIDSPTAEALREEYLAWISIAWDPSVSLSSHREKARAHVVYWNLETRYPGLAEEILSIRGSAPFVSGRIRQAIESERDILVDLHRKRSKDRIAFVESLRSFLDAS